MQSRGTRARLWLAAILMATLLGCGDGAKGVPPVQAGEIRHPVAEYMPYQDVPALEWELNVPGGDEISMWQMLGIDSSQGNRFGGDAATPLSAIDQIVAFADGAIVGDVGEGHAYWISTAGIVIARIGRPGEGPGEFRRITAITPVGKDRLAISDIGRRVEEFTGRDTLRYDRTVPLTFSPTSMCSTGNEVFAYASPGGADAVAPIRVMNTDWEELRSFGEGYDAPNPLVTHSFRQANLICANHLERLVVVTPGLPEVYILTTEGVPTHRIVWTDFQSFDIVESEGGLSATMGPGGVNRLRSGSMVDDSLVLLQYDYLSEADAKAKEDFTKLQSVIINLISGEVVARSTTWPPLTVLPGGMAIRTAPDGWPGVTMYPRGGQ